MVLQEGICGRCLRLKQLGLLVKPAQPNHHPRQGPMVAHDCLLRHCIKHNCAFKPELLHRSDTDQANYHCQMHISRHGMMTGTKITPVM